MDIQALYERQCGRIYRIAMLYLKNSSDAEDAVQTIFLKYMEKPVTFRDSEHEKAWFITAARNRCRDMLRSFWRKKVDLGELPEGGEAEMEESRLLSLILELPPKYREVLYLYYYEEYPVREMSHILDRKESTIQTQLADARRKLKKAIERKGNDSHVR